MVAVVAVSLCTNSVNGRSVVFLYSTSYPVMLGPVYSGSCQITFRLVVDVSPCPDTTAGAAGAAGASTTFVTVIVTVRGVRGLSRASPSSTLTVTVYEALVSVSSGAFVMSCPGRRVDVERRRVHASEFVGQRLAELDRALVGVGGRDGVADVDARRRVLRNAAMSPVPETNSRIGRVDRRFPAGSSPPARAAKARTPTRARVTTVLFSFIESPVEPRLGKLRSLAPPASSREWHGGPSGFSLHPGLHNMSTRMGVS